MKGKYQTNIIRTREQFADLKPEWENVYNSDPDAMFYVSWAYLNAWFNITEDNWFVIAVKDQQTSEYIGFLPLKKNEKRKIGFTFYSLLTMATSSMPVYSGFVCHPEKFDEFSKEVVSYLVKKNKWDKLFMSNIIDARIDRFLLAFDIKKFLIENNQVLSSLKLTLPDSYDKYISEYFGRDSRNLMRRRIKRVENEVAYKVTKTTKETLERDADILTQMWNKRWGKIELGKIEHEIILRLFDDNRSWVYILWHEEKPIGALSFLEDKPKSTIYAHITAYDMEYNKVSPGSVVFIYGIKYAIEQGFKYFDFAQGLDAYKLAFKASPVDVFTARVTRKTMKANLLDRL